MCLEQILMGDTTEIDSKAKYEVFDRKFSLLPKRKAEKYVSDYVSSSIENIFIKFGDSLDCSSQELLENDQFRTWVFQTPMLLATNFDDDANLVRGFLDFMNLGKCYHSWIEFYYVGKYYVFDPCFNILCEKDFYDIVLEPEVINKISSKKVKEAVYNTISANEGASRVPFSNDVDDIFYKTDFDLSGDVEDGKIKTLKARYYYSC